MNGHRIQRVLHLVRHAGHQAAERGQLARIVQRGVHVCQVAEIARDQHRSEEPAGRILDGVAQQEPFRPFLFGLRGRPERIARFGAPAPRCSRALSSARRSARTARSRFQTRASGVASSSCKYPLAPAAALRRLVSVPPFLFLQE